jgi:hypothetical protein
MVKERRKAVEILRFALAFKKSIGLWPMLGAEVNRHHEGIFLEQLRMRFQCDQPFPEFFGEGVTIFEALHPIEGRPPR